MKGHDSQDTTNIEMLSSLHDLGNKHVFKQNMTDEKDNFSFKQEMKYKYGNIFVFFLSHFFASKFIFWWWLELVTSQRSNMCKLFCGTLEFATNQTC